MFLRKTERRKDGKTHLYWSVVENKRLASEGPRVLSKALMRGPGCQGKADYRCDLELRFERWTNTDANWHERPDEAHSRAWRRIRRSLERRGGRPQAGGTRRRRRSGRSSGGQRHALARNPRSQLRGRY